LPVKPAIDPIKTALVGGCAVAVAGAMLTLLADPTKGLQDRLDNLPQVHGLSLPVSQKAQIDVAGLADKPIFVMTTGRGAYKEKTLQLFGLAISPGRKAALVSVDGAMPAWMAVGETAGDIRLTDVGTNGASFETPIGSRTVGLSDSAPAKTGASASASASSQPPQGG